MDFLFVLGRIPRLSMAELESVLRRNNFSADITKLSSQIVLVKTARPIPEAVFFELGGSIKFGQIKNIITDDDLDQQIASHIDKNLLGLSFVGGKAINIAKAIKKMGKIRRFILPSRDLILTSAQSKGILKKGQEFLAVKYKERIYLAEILAVQDIDDFTRRDRGLPEVDTRRGMLPTKIARIMVNLAWSDNIAKPIIVDPFCGTGRILMEALLLGADIVGSDIDPKAVQATRANLFWLAQNYNIARKDFKEKIQVVNVTDIADNMVFKDLTANLLITEPYLGPPQRHQPNQRVQKEIFAELSPLYLQLFSQATKILKPPAKLVVVFPEINHVNLRAQLIDKINALGYITIDAFKVGRPGQFIKREIVILVFRG